jgi:8-oxo-dGTP pyrophosphatase MutT (NUDIX family)
MSKYTDYFTWLADGGWIRVSARAIILNRERDELLIERNSGIGYEFSNFLGGAVEVGETLLDCIDRELKEETNTTIKRADYLFVVENYFSHNSEIRHSLEHYFEIELDRYDVSPKSQGVAYTWTAVDELGKVDLRPVVVRNCIMDGTYRRVNHLTLRDTSD